MAVQLPVEEPKLMVSPFLLYHTRGKVDIFVVHKEGDDLCEVGVFYLTEVAALLGRPGKTYEEMVVFFERQP